MSRRALRTRGRLRGSTADTDDLSSTTILKPMFSVPTDINESDDADKDYEYTVTLSASGITDVTEDVKVTGSGEAGYRLWQ